MLRILKLIFLKKAVELQIQGGITDDEIDVILEKELATHFCTCYEEAAIFKTMAKFPPHLD